MTIPENLDPHDSLVTQEVFRKRPHRSARLRLKNAGSGEGEFQGSFARLIRDNERGYVIRLEARQMFGADDRSVEELSILLGRSSARQPCLGARAKEQ